MIYEYTCYRKWLSNEFKIRNLENPSFSLSAFAKKLGISQSQFSLILSGKRNINIKNAQNIANVLGLNDKEFEYFKVMIFQTNASIDKIQNVFADELNRIKKENNVTEIDMEYFRIISDWQAIAVLECLNIKSIEPTIKGISDKLNIDQAIIGECMKRLILVKLVHEKNGYYTRATGDIIKTSNEITSKALKKFHTQMLSKANIALETQSIDERFFSGVTLAINPNKISDAKKIIGTFQKEIMSCLQEGEKENVYHFFIQLFNVENKK